MDGNSELPGLVDQVVGDAAAGEADEALGQEFQELVVSPERSGTAVHVPVRLADNLVNALRLGPASRDLLRTLSAAVHEHHIRVLAVDVVQSGADRLGVVDGLAAGDGDERALRQVRLGLLILAGAKEVPGIDRRGGQLRGAAGVRAVTRSPGVAGVAAVVFGGGIAQLLEGVAPVAEVAGALDDSLQFPGVYFSPVLRALQVLQLRREPVDGAVQSLSLHVQGIDETPEQRFPLIGELGAVGCDFIDEEVDDLVETQQRLVMIPDGSGIGFASGRRSSELLEVLADDGGRRDGLSVFECIHRFILVSKSESPRGIPK